MTYRTTGNKLLLRVIEEPNTGKIISTETSNIKRAEVISTPKVIHQYQIELEAPKNGDIVWFNTRDAQQMPFEKTLYVVDFFYLSLIENK